MSGPLYAILAAALVVAAVLAVVAARKASRRRVAIPADEPAGRDAKLAALEDRLARPFANADLLIQAVTHSSYANEVGGGIAHNETLEFLGDAVIELISSRILYEHKRDMREGEMSKIRAMVVNKTSLSGLAGDLDLGAVLRLSVGERQSGGRRKASLLANAYEALVAAVFLDGGFDAAFTVFAPPFARRIEDAMAGRLDTVDYKTRLQEVCQARFGAPPSYRIIDESGPDHAKRFTSELRIDGRVLGTGTGRSKKEAEQIAARGALETLENGDGE